MEKELIYEKKSLEVKVIILKLKIQNNLQQNL